MPNTLIVEMKTCFLKNMMCIVKCRLYGRAELLLMLLTIPQNSLKLPIFILCHGLQRLITSDILQEPFFFCKNRSCYFKGKAQPKTPTWSLQMPFLNLDITTTPFFKISKTSILSAFQLPVSGKALQWISCCSTYLSNVQVWFMSFVFSLH